MSNSGDPLRGDAQAWKAAHPPQCPNRPWGYGADLPPPRPPTRAAAARGLQLILAATAGAAGYAYYHKVNGYPCDKHHHHHSHHSHQQKHQAPPGGHK